MKIYTKKGDSGKTSFGIKRVPKNCIEVKALGNVDELDALIGLAVSKKLSQKNEGLALKIQNDLHRITAELVGLGKKGSEIQEKDIKFLEETIDSFELPELTKFILPGGSEQGALLHLCRAVSRKTERSILDAEKNIKISKELKAYVNRLSDLFFSMARFENLENGFEEKNPDY